MDDRFFNAFLPPSATICGRRLDRFTLWHQFLLAAARNPVTDPSADITPADLLAAVAILRTSYRDPIPAASVKDRAWLWAMCRWQDVFEREARRLFDWVAIQSSPPRYFRTNQPEGIRHTLDSGPQCLSYKAALMSRGGFCEHDAWNMPFGQAMWEIAQLAANESSDIHFLDDADIDPSPVDISTMSEGDALAMFMRDLPTEALALASFEHWRANIKRPEQC